MTKEQIYDLKIYPLMSRVIALATKHGIAMVANFAIPTAEDSGLQVLTSLPDENGSIPERHAAAVRAIRPPQLGVVMVKKERAEGTATLTAFI